MAEEVQRSSFATTLLVGVVILVALLLVGVLVAPVADCPTCRWMFPERDVEIQKLETLTGCNTCGGRTRISLFKGWRLRRAP